MADTSFTPGPWETGEASWNHKGEVRYTLHGVFNAKAADAHLIAAAPELYEALETLFNSYKDLADSGDAGFWKLEDCKEGQQALAVLAKARGEAAE